MGWLAFVTEGLTAPMVAHGVYDILALEYIAETRTPVDVWDWSEERGSRETVWR